MAKHHFIENPTNYSTIHSWNNLHHPKTGTCSHCGKREKRHEWALIHGKEHARDISHYIELCKRCHIKYDRNEEWVQNNIKSLQTTPSHLNPLVEKACEYCKNTFMPKKRISRYCSNKCSAQDRPSPVRDRDERGMFKQDK